jgi:hypothetical protein
MFDIMSSNPIADAILEYTKNYLISLVQNSSITQNIANSIYTGVSDNIQSLTLKLQQYKNKLIMTGNTTETNINTVDLQNFMVPILKGLIEKLTQTQSNFNIGMQNDINFINPMNNIQSGFNQFDNFSQIPQIDGFSQPSFGSNKPVLTFEDIEDDNSSSIPDLSNPNTSQQDNFEVSDSLRDEIFNEFNNDGFYEPDNNNFINKSVNTFNDSRVSNINDISVIRADTEDIDDIDIYADIKDIKCNKFTDNVSEFCDFYEIDYTKRLYKSVIQGIKWLFDVYYGESSLLSKNFPWISKIDFHIVTEYSVPYSNFNKDLKMLCMIYKNKKYNKVIKGLNKCSHGCYNIFTDLLLDLINEKVSSEIKLHNKFRNIRINNLDRVINLFNVLEKERFFKDAQYDAKTLYSRMMTNVFDIIFGEDKRYELLECNTKSIMRLLRVNNLLRFNDKNFIETDYFDLDEKDKKRYFDKLNQNQSFLIEKKSILLTNMFPEMYFKYIKNIKDSGTAKLELNNSLDIMVNILTNMYPKVDTMVLMHDEKFKSYNICRSLYKDCIYLTQKL